ncbi:MAG TPA: acetylxylan esterase [Natronincola sp.]|nr:acetylxylan esterase [Natronincola sp.]
MNYYSPIPELKCLSHSAPRYPFEAKNKEEALRWQINCGKALNEVVGFLDGPTVDPEPQFIEEIDCGTFVRSKMVIRTAKNAKMPFYLLKPKKQGKKLPVILAYHGHGRGVSEIVGIHEPHDYQKNFAVELCKRGFVVIAPEISCFGERQEDYSNLKPDQTAPSTCHQAATWAIMLGKSILGLRIRDSMRLLDYVLTLPEIMHDKIGVMGISGGGMLAMFHSALDFRIKAIVLSGYFGNFSDNILGLHHCTCNFAPGILTVGDFQDLIGLLAPRPLLVEAGHEDPIFPIDSVRSAFLRTQEIYEVFGCDLKSTLHLDEFPGKHEISGRISYDFLIQHLFK